jgi:hypothetical protein
MNSVVSVKKEINALKQQTRLKPQVFVEVEVSNKLIVDWTKVSQVGFERSIIRSEVNV